MTQSAARRRDEWQLQEAKAQFSELVRQANSEGPQWVTKQGRPAVVVLSIEDYERLRAPRRQQRLSEFLRSSPLTEISVTIDRSPESMRDVPL